MVGQIAGTAMTFNYPNFLGTFYNITPTDTKFTTMLGGLTSGGLQTAGVGESTLFTWQEEDLRAAARRTHPEGADAPAPTANIPSPVFNVLQIVHESVGMSYTKMAAIGQLADVGSAHPQIAQVVGSQPVRNPYQRQLMLKFREIARDAEVSALTGRFNEPSDNNANRETRGIIEATTTNVISKGGDPEDVSGVDAVNNRLTVTATDLDNGDQVQLTGEAGTDFPVELDRGTTYYVVDKQTNAIGLSLTLGGDKIALTDSGDGGTVVKSGAFVKDDINSLLQKAWQSGGLQEEETATLWVNGWNRRELSRLFIGDVANTGYRVSSRTVAGVRVDTIMTDFGELNVVLNRHMPKDTIQVASMEWCGLAHLLVPDKGFLFVEPLGKKGAREEAQIYGEWGLYYGNERAHAKLTNLAFTEV